VFGGKGAAPQCGSCIDAMGEILDETIASGERHLMAAE
jgi:bacterioferritin-associated ferredoxin